MHIANGILSDPVCAVTAGVSALAVGYSFAKLREKTTVDTVPLTAALVFAGQMVNFPIYGVPVSGHLMGGVLAAAILGPWAGCIAMTLVLLVQCALFGDGGWTALGANVLHMAVIGSIGGYAVMAGFRQRFGNGRFATLSSVVVASWLTVLAAASLFCLEFGLSSGASNFALSQVFALMVQFHAAIGIGEACITAVAVGLLFQYRPQALALEGRSSAPVPRLIATGLIVALAIAAFCAPLASSFPDGLEAVANQTGFHTLIAAPTLSIFSDYTLPLPVGEAASTALAGLLGTCLVFGMAMLVGRAMRRQQQTIGG